MGGARRSVPADAIVAFNRLVDTYAAKYPRAVEKLTKDRDALLPFYDFPSEHWQHVRTTNPIESTFATVRHRMGRTRKCLSSATFLAMADIPHVLRQRIFGAPARHVGVPLLSQNRLRHARDINGQLVHRDV